MWWIKPVNYDDDDSTVMTQRTGMKKTQREHPESAFQRCCGNYVVAGVQTGQTEHWLVFFYLEATTPFVHTPHKVINGIPFSLFLLKISSIVPCLWMSITLKLFALICPLLTSHVPHGSSELAWTMMCQSQLGLDWFLLAACLTDSLVHIFSQWMI